MTEPAFPDALPAHSRLHWYVIEKVLGQGGFGITYLARDNNLDQTVAIKEYLPVEVATRLPDATIRARTEELRDRYRWGLERFIQEARILARFDHRNIVRVQSVFEMNGTAYMVMRFERGVTLAALLDRRGTLPEGELLGTILPILDGLELVHQAGFIHRDIKPENIHIGDDGTPVLLDFGSARQALGTDHTLTILVAPGYAPFEQYYSDSASQGPWTDIYGLGATCYRAIAGRPPLDAVSRSKGILGSTQEVMVAAAIIGAGRYSGRVLAAIDHALAFGEKDRPQSIDEWRRELAGEPVVATTVTKTSPPAAPRAISATAPPASAKAAPVPPSTPPAPTASAPSPRPAAAATPRDGSPARLRLAWTLGGVLVVVVGVGIYLVGQWNSETRTRIAGLEAQIQEKERSAQRAEAARADAERAAKQQADDDARARQDRERQAIAAQETATAEATRSKRDADVRAQQDAPKRRENVATARPPTTPAPPARIPTADRAAAAVTPASTPAAIPPVASPTPVAMPSIEHGASAKASPVAPAAAEPERAAPAPSPAERLASAERALAAGQDADAIAVLKSLAEGGNAQAQVRLGDMYADARGTSRDPAAAQHWYEKAALQGDTAAQLKLGAWYAPASGAPRNNNLAYVWYGTAARLGSGAAKTERDRIGALLQPAEREQADRLIESNVSRMPKKP